MLQSMESQRVGYGLVTEQQLLFSATQMDLEVIVLSEVSQAEKEKYMISYVQNLKDDINELIYETETEMTL